MNSLIWPPDAMNAPAWFRRVTFSVPTFDHPFPCKSYRNTSGVAIDQWPQPANTMVPASAP